MIHVVIGTKAQLVKVAPLMSKLQERGIPYNFIYTGQHKETMDALRQNFSIKNPDIVLHRGKDIKSLHHMALWLIKILALSLFRRKEIFQGDRRGLVIVHGDTFSTLLGALMGKLAGHKVAHMESGLRSFNIWHPFPEELTRIVTFWFTDVFYCPGSWAVNNLSRFKGEKVDTIYNSLLDSLRHATTRFNHISMELPAKPYCVATTHRFENIFSKNSFVKNIELIERAAARMKCIFILHPVTEKKLRDFDLFDRLAQNENVEFRPRYDYFRFINLVYHAEFLLTDGGSNQEECFYMGKPCLLLRKATERQEGLGTTTVISNYSGETVEEFLNNYKTKAGELLTAKASPTEIITDHVASYA